MTQPERPDLPEDDSDDDDLETPDVEVEAEQSEQDDPTGVPPDEGDQPSGEPDARTVEL